jgi:hypothetical protein
MPTDNRTDFRKMVDATIDNHIPDRREHTGPDRRQLDHLPMTEKRDGRTADRRSVVVNTTIRPAGGPNGRDAAQHRILDDLARAEYEEGLYNRVPNSFWATVPGTDEHELATLDRACEDENRALKACCESAADEINEILEWGGKMSRNIASAIIYKHMRNGREL